MQFSQYTLHNGLRYLYINRPGGLFYCGMYVKCGEDDETDETLEIAHYLEHLGSMFTSAKYPSSTEINATFDNIGVQTNASTGNKQTDYYMEGPVASAGHLLDIFTSSFADFQVDEKLVHQEASAVRHELRENWLNQPWSDADEKLKQVTYGNHIRAISTKRHLENVSALEDDISKVLEFRRRMYTSDRMAWIVAGPWDDPEFSDAVTNGAARLEGCTRSDPRLQYHVASRPSGDRAYLIALHDVNSTRVTIRYELPYNGSNRVAMETVRHVVRLLSDGFSSRLMKRLRVELGLVYDIEMLVDVDAEQEDLSYLTIQTTCDPGAAHKIIDEVCKATQAEVSSDERTKLVHGAWRDRCERMYDHSPGRAVMETADIFLWQNFVRTPASIDDDVNAGMTELNFLLHKLSVQTPLVLIAAPM